MAMGLTSFGFRSRTALTNTILPLVADAILMKTICPLASGAIHTSGLVTRPHVVFVLDGAGYVGIRQTDFGHRIRTMARHIIRIAQPDLDNASRQPGRRYRARYLL